MDNGNSTIQKRLCARAYTKLDEAAHELAAFRKRIVEKHGGEKPFSELELCKAEGVKERYLIKKRDEAREEYVRLINNLI